MGGRHEAKGCVHALCLEDAASLSRCRPSRVSIHGSPSASRLYRASLVSVGRPSTLLYPFVDHFLDNLDTDEPVVRWEAVCTLGNLATVDKQHKISVAVPRITPNLRDKSIVLQGHSVRALAKIARANPEKGAEILNALIGAADAFPGNRVGFAVEAMEYFLEAKPLLPKVRAFVESHRRSDIHVVAAKARKLLKRMPSP